jgi:hypothetical protein
MNSDERRASGRERVRRWRQRHAAELLIKAEVARVGKPGRAPKHYVCELVDALDGYPLWVGILRVGQEPPWLPGSRRSTRWTPGVAMSLATCRAVLRDRKQRLAAWTAGRWRPTVGLVTREGATP